MSTSPRRGRDRTAISGAVSAALLVALAAGCGSTPEPTPVASREVSVLNQLMGERTSAELLFVEDEIALCMTLEGFEYVPQPIVDQPDPYVTGYYTLDYREEFGLGISTAGETSSGEAQEGQTANDRHLATLDGAAFESWVAQEAACFDRAWERVEEIHADARNSLPEGLNDEIAALAFHTSESFIEPMDNWSECMAGHGFDFSDQITMFLELQEAFELLAEDQPQVLEFKAYERAVAVADLDCYDRFVVTTANEERQALEDRIEDTLGQSSLFDR